MKFLHLFLMICTVFASPILAEGRDEKYTEEMFRRALKEESTSPLYLLVTIDTPNTGVHTVCVSGPFLRGAIRIEKNLSFEDALRFAMKSWGKTLVFKNPQATQNIAPRYTAAQLKEVSQALEKYSRREILAELRDRGAPPVIRALFLNKGSQAMAYRDALAYALLERVILVENDCRSGTLFSP